MLITLYSFSKRKNSTKQPNTGTQVGVNLKSPTSKYNPTFIIGNINPLSYTYLKWEDRYYYIDDIRLIRDHYYELVCSLDVLATYKANVLATTAYVAYSSSNFSTHIVDNRLSTIDTLSTKSSSSTLFSDGVGSIMLGTYIITYVSSSPTYGASGVTWASEPQAINIVKMLSTEGFTTWQNEFPKQLLGAYDALLSVTAVPFSWYQRELSFSHPPNILLGGYDTGVASHPPNPRVEYSTTVSIPWQYEDFRNLEPYTSLLLFLPGYGLVELNPNDFIGKTSITIKAVVDGLTGKTTYIVDKVYKATTTLGVNMNVGTVSYGNLLYSSLSLAQSTLSSLTGLFSTNPIGALTSSINSVPQLASSYISSQQRSLGSIGSNGASNDIYASIGSWADVICTTLSHPTNVDPSVFTSTLGRPCNQVISLSSLTGYVQTVNASVSISNSIHATEVNNLLNGGVYIE